MTGKQLSPSDLLASQFLEKAKEFQENVELIKVLKSRTYHIGNSNVLVRAASEGNRRYFFGINYITIEEMANLDNQVELKLGLDISGVQQALYDMIQNFQGTDKELSKAINQIEKNFKTLEAAIKRL